ncbi:MAG: hypothetical protein RIS47_481 [Bacteroidota bacterium]|jgi:predicted DNA-binding protein (MmcQ/YjbR family)
MTEIDKIRSYCISKQAVTESFPFDETSLVLKVGNKIFAILSLDASHSINLKCEPERAVVLREENTYIEPGYHMNKRHWNTLKLDEAPYKQVCELIDHSYELVYNALSKKTKESIQNT